MFVFKVQKPIRNSTLNTSDIYSVQTEKTSTFLVDQSSIEFTLCLFG